MSEEQVITGAAVNLIENEPNILKIEHRNEKKSLQSNLALGVLRKLQLETKAIEMEFFERIYEMETDYQKKHELVYKKRCDIINGVYIPTEAEGYLCEFDIKKSGPDSKADELINGQETKEAEVTVASNGVQQFWLNVLSSTLFEINPNDAPILVHLVDIRAKNKPILDLGFILEFVFAPNEYFENSVLTKEYFYTCSSANTIFHEGPQIYKSVGCEIKWKEGKSPTNYSFFDYFRSNQTVTDSSCNLIIENMGMPNDFEMGYFIKERIIPRAVLYYTGEKLDFLNASSIISESNESDDSSSSLDASKPLT